MFDENFLMAIATIRSICYWRISRSCSSYAILSSRRDVSKYAVNKSRKSITSLMDIRPDYANVKDGNETKSVPEDVQIG